jgi:hypothetical protein
VLGVDPLRLPVQEAGLEVASDRKIAGVQFAVHNGRGAGVNAGPLVIDEAVGAQCVLLYEPIVSMCVTTGGWSQRSSMFSWWRRKASSSGSGPRPFSLLETWTNVTPSSSR